MYVVLTLSFFDSKYNILFHFTVQIGVEYGAWLAAFELLHCATALGQGAMLTLKDAISDYNRIRIRRESLKLTTTY